MPIYEYQCQSCGERSEFMQKVTDDLMVACPHCKKEALKKIVSSTSFQLKGSGWYVTDFRDKGKKCDDVQKDKMDKPDEKKTENTKGEQSDKPDKKVKTEAKED